VRPGAPVTASAVRHGPHGYRIEDGFDQYSSGGGSHEYPKAKLHFEDYTDYSNSIFHGFPAVLAGRLQAILNAAALLVTSSLTRQHSALNSSPSIGYHTLTTSASNYAS